MSGIQFRRAVPADAPLLASTRQRAWASTYRGIYPDAWIDNYDYAGKLASDRANLENPEISSFLVMDGEVCAGYFSYGPTETGEIYLRNLYLLPPWKGKGLGRRVLRQLAEYCAARGCAGFYVHCNYHNHKARGFYEKMGGKLVGNNGFHQNKAEDQCRYDFTLEDLIVRR